MNAKFVSPVLMWAVVIAGAGVSLLFAPEVRILDAGALGAVLFSLALANWTYFFSAAIWTNREAVKSAAGISRIRTTGPYGIVRHPIYFADTVLVWGAFFLFGSLKALLAAAWLTLVLVYWAKLEERALVLRFGKDYENYRGRVPMFIPKLFG
jgi:protein-S-isoprenylcysteine O-methyltransferase Ste14